MISSALKGIRVIDFTQVAAGPTCSMMLADLGADVVKIEAPSGDLCRALAPHVGDESVFFMALNGNKRSAALDLKNPADCDVAMTLCSHADVVLESFRPGVMDRLGLGYEDISKLNERVIYGAISGFGQHGPWRDLPGVDGVLQALSGLMSINGSPGMPPSKMQVPIVDSVTGYLGATAVLAALHQRSSTGQGQYLDINMFSSAVALQHGSFASYFATGEKPVPIGSAAPYAAPNEALQCQDGWIMVAAYHPKRWKSVCEIIGQPSLADDPRFASLQSRLDNRQELVAQLEHYLKARAVDEWQRLFREVDIICGGIYDYEQVEASEHFQALGLKETVVHPTAGLLTMPRFVLSRSDETPNPRRPAPTLGQHSEEIRAEAFAMSASACASMATPKQRIFSDGYQI